MDSNNILSIVAIVVSIGGALITAVNHTRVRSACCGRRVEMSIDIEKTTPILTIKGPHQDSSQTQVQV